MKTASKQNGARAIAPQPLKIGDTIWEFDINRRIYPQGRKMLGGGPPLYSEHFISATITGETAQSWLIESSGRTRKVNKKTMLQANGIYTPISWHTTESMGDDIWIHENRHVLSSKVGVERDVSKLKRIAAILEE